jgi:hypothetical protein
MKFCDTFRRSLFCFVFGCALLGCSEQKTFLLDKDDIHFAGFYSDYLLESGVVPANENLVLSSLDSSDINVLLVRHALTRERLNRKIVAYKNNPELWRSVLKRVRANILKKTDAGQ